MSHKRYLVFAHWDYRPQGGLGDLKASFDDFRDAVSCAENIEEDHYEIYDRIEGVEVVPTPYQLAICDNPEAAFPYNNEKKLKDDR